MKDVQGITASGFCARIELLSQDQVPIYRFDEGVEVRAFHGEGWKETQSFIVFDSGITGVRDVVIRSEEIAWSGREEFLSITMMALALGKAPIVHAHICFPRGTIGFWTASPFVWTDTFPHIESPSIIGFSERLWREAMMMEVMEG